jgi:hypothetical protein
MPTKKQITDALRERLSDVAERGKVIGQALRLRADMAVTRRRLRSIFAELGEEIYERMIGGSNGSISADDTLNSFRTRIEGLKEELKSHEEELEKAMHPDHARVEADAAKESESQP